MEISRPDKILLALHALGRESSQPCKYEDIVVKAFQLFPKDFQLRGYPQYPDSSDIHKPLYGPLKRAGLVRAANKTFSLTERGLTRAINISTNVGQTVGTTTKRLTRDVHEEINRIRKTTGWQLFITNELEKLLDTDFYSYLGVTVRTERNDFIGRLNSVSDAIETIMKLEPGQIADGLMTLHKHMMRAFAELIRKKTGAKQ